MENKDHKQKTISFEINDFYWNNSLLKLMNDKN